MSPVLSSVYSSPGGAPQWAVMASASSFGSSERTAVGGERDPGRRGAELLLGEPFGVVAAGRDQRVDQLVAVFGEAVAEVVAGRPHGPQQRDGGRRGVQADRVAHPGVLGGVGGEHDGDALGRVRGLGQPGVPDGDPGQPGGPLGVGGVAGIPSGPSSLNENGTVIRRPSNSGIATCMAASIGASAAFEASHCARELVRHRPWSTGTSRRASTPASQSPSLAASPMA